MELRRSKGHDVHLDAVDRVHLAVGRRGRGLLLELALLVAGHFLVAQQRRAGRSAVSVAALLPMREHTAGPVSRAAVALASAFSVLGDCLRVDQKTRRPTARPVARFGPHLSSSRHHRRGAKAKNAAAASTKDRCPGSSHASRAVASFANRGNPHARQSFKHGGAWGDAASRACIDCACCPRRHAHGYAQMPHAFGPCAVRKGCPV